MLMSGLNINHESSGDCPGGLISVFTIFLSCRNQLSCLCLHVRDEVKLVCQVLALKLSRQLLFTN